MAAGTGTTIARYPSIDFLKALAIVAVVLQHVRLPAPPDTGLLWLDHALDARWLTFHVPTFLVVSGFLYYRPQPTRLRDVGARLRRLLLPYALASAVVLALGLGSPFRRDLADSLFALATGSALGVYYYVFVAAICTLSIWPLSRVPGRWLGWVALAVVVVSVASRIHPLLGGRFWTMRDPTNYFAACFVVGWLSAANAPRLRELGGQGRRAIFAVCLLVLCLFASFDQPGAPQIRLGLTRFAYTLALVGGVALIARNRAVPRSVAMLSRATYPIYLYHLVFILLLRPQLPALAPLARAGLELVIGLGAGLALCWLGEKLLGRHARSWLGLA